MSGIILKPRNRNPEDDEYEEDFYIPPERPLPPRPPDMRGRGRSHSDVEDPMEDLPDTIHLHSLPEPSDGSGDDAEAADSKKAEETAKSETTDAGFLYFSLFVGGLAIPLPFYCFLIATDYYLERFQSDSIIFDISMTYLAANFAGVLFGNLFVEAIAFHARIMGGYALSLTSLLVITIFDMLLELFDAEKGFKLTLAALGISSFGSSVVQTSMYGYTSMLPQRYTQAVMAGESFAGTIVSLAKIITTAVMFTNLALSAAIFFGFCMGALFMGMLLFHVSRQGPTASKYVEASQAAVAAESANFKESEKAKVLHRDGSQHSQKSQKNYGTSGDKKKTTGTDPVDTTALDVSEAVRSRCKAVCDLWPYVIGIALTYCVTTSLHPTAMSRITSGTLMSWMPVLLYSLYNFSDLLGKILSSCGNIWSGPQLMLWAASRIIFVALILLCLVPLGRPILAHEAYSSVLSALLGVTNGYLASVCMMEAGKAVDDSGKEVAGNIMTLALCFGLTAGIGFSYMWDLVINMTKHT